MYDFKVDQCFVMNGFFFFFPPSSSSSSVGLPIISSGGLSYWRWLHDGERCSSATHQQASQQRPCVFGTAVGLIALTRRTFPQTFVGRLPAFKPLVHLALKMKLNTSCRQVQAASDGALLFISSIDQPDAALPYVAVYAPFLLR